MMLGNAGFLSLACRKMTSVIANTSPKAYVRCLHTSHVDRKFPMQYQTPKTYRPSLNKLCQERSFCSNSAVRPFDSYALTHRALLCLSGKDTFPLLQGLLTNDVQLLENSGSCIYSFLLNVKGRILYDLLLFQVGNSKESPTIYIECDRAIRPDLAKLFKMYKLKRKVDISLCDDIVPWAVLPSSYLSPNTTGNPPVTLGVGHADKVITSVVDPRLPQLGWRLLLPAQVSCVDVVPDAALIESPAYAARRYYYGIAEGGIELPPGNCLPLESNGTFLNAISFTKGCYIGQELTARTQHVGVTRKRMMPVVFSSDNHTSSNEDTVKNTANKNCGKVRGVSGKYGIALLRLPDVLGESKRPLTSLKEDNITGTFDTSIPHWWKIESDHVISRVILKENVKIEST